MKFEEILNELKDNLSSKKEIHLKGDQKLNISSVINVAYGTTKVKLSPSREVITTFNKVNEAMMEQVRNGVAMYGTTTSYGGRAGVVLNKGDEDRRVENATNLSNSIVHVDVSTGPEIPKEIVRAAMLIRINMLLPGVSGIRLETLEKLNWMVNNNITPIVGRYGSVGASGDLAQNGRVLSCLLQLPGVMVRDKNGNAKFAKKVFKDLKIKPLELAPKEGLALVNGDNFSSASCLIVAYETLNLMLINFLVNALVIQVLKGSDRNFHPFLSKMRPHYGQMVVAGILRNLLTGSRLSRHEMNGHKERVNGEIIQDPYSIRCLPQYYGPEVENFLAIWETLKININSVSDNPLWVPPESTTEGEEPYQWVSGGNFMAMHMSDSLDKLRKILVHLIKLNDRHLARMVHPHFSNGLPANLSDKDAVSQSTFKGLQTQMGMYEVYSSLLVSPASTAFGNHEEFNQDITSHAPSSSILSWELLKIAKLSTATNLVAVCQAVDLRGGADLLSPATKGIYDWVRTKVPYLKKEQPLGHLVEKLSEKFIQSDLLKKTLRNIKI